MKKKLLLTALISALTLSLASCGSNNGDKKSQVTGDGAEASATAAATAAAAAAAADATSLPAVTPDAGAIEAAKKSADNANVDSNYIAATIAPAATASPESAQKAQEKVDNAGGETNVSISDTSGEHKVNLKFTLENHTGVDFPAMLLSPVDVDLKNAPNVLGGQIFQDGMSLDLNPSIPEGIQLTTTLFNIVPVDANGRGYVFQNIDLSTSSVIQLYLDNGVPKAVIN